jgi:hypothetical protein
LQPFVLADKQSGSSFLNSSFFFAVSVKDALPLLDDSYLSDLEDSKDNESDPN